MSELEKDTKDFDEKFKPDGALVFFGLLLLLGAFVWFTVYYLMLQRA